MRKRLLKNWGLKLTSLLLAFTLWLLVVQIDDPAKSVSFNNVPVKLINTELLEQQNKVYEILDNTDTVRVTINAPRSIADQIRPSEIVAEADIRKLTDINTVAINYYVNYEVDEITGDHDVVRLNVEDKKSKWVKLQYNTVGDVAEGYMVASVSPDQTMINVTGPESVIDLVSYAGVDIGVTGATNNLSANVEIDLFDADGNLLENSGIQKNVDYVHMAVEILAVKEVPIELNVTGTPAEGYLATGQVQCEPAYVTVAGTSYALSVLNKISIPEERLDISGATENVVEIVSVRDYLPDNIRLATGGFTGRAQITIYIEPEVEKTLKIPESQISIVNVPADFTASFPELDTDEAVEPYILEVSGLGELVNPLTAEAVQGVIDIAAWMRKEEKETLSPGTYSIPISFNLSEEVTVKGDTTARIAIRSNASRP